MPMLAEAYLSAAGILNYFLICYKFPIYKLEINKIVWEIVILTHRLSSFPFNSLKSHYMLKPWCNWSSCIPAACGEKVFLNISCKRTASL